MDIPFRIRKKVLETINFFIVELLISIQNILTTWVQEVWRLGLRFINVIFVIVLSLFNKQAVRQWFEEHRGRIKRTASFKDIEEMISETDLLSQLEKILKKQQEGLDKEGEPPAEEDYHSHTSEDEHVLWHQNQNTPPLSPTTKRRTKIFYNVDNIDPPEAIYTNDKVTTGFFEDLRLGSVLWIERLSIRAQKRVSGFLLWLMEFRFRRFVVSLFGFHSLLHRCRQIWDIIYNALLCPFYLAKAPGKIHNASTRFVNSQTARIDSRLRSDIVRSFGLPYERYDVNTEDGYILCLERLPRPNSKKAIYFQHGVMDSAFSWFAITHAIQSPAFRAYDLGYDVWAGTLRGCDKEKNHTNPNISPKNYWDFSVNEHAWKDLPAFIAKIKEIKEQELAEIEKKIREEKMARDTRSDDDVQANLYQSDNVLRSTSDGEILSPILERENSTSKLLTKDKKFSLTVIAHSMGAMCTLMNIIHSRLRNIDHGITAAILLSPAGIHKTAPLLCRITGPFLWLMLKVFNWPPVFKVPSDFLHVVIAKMMEDVRKNYSSRSIISLMASKLLGGSIDNHAFTKVPCYSFNVFAGCPAGVFKHFWQIFKNQKFQAYDYGKDGNLKHYGTPEPLNFLDHYDSIDIPVYFVMGMQDTLIEPLSILDHYEHLRAVHPKLAFLKPFSKFGHIDFTIGENSKVTNYIFSILSAVNKDQKPQRRRWYR